MDAESPIPTLDSKNPIAVKNSKPHVKISNCERCGVGSKEFSETRASYRSLEGFKLTARSTSGDTLELTAFRYEEWQAVSGRNSKTENAESSSGEGVRKLWDAVRKELRDQQKDLLRSLLSRPESGHPGPDAPGEAAFRRMTLINLEERWTRDSEENAEETSEELDIDPYWNADNTSERIVQFAMGFAAIHGKDESFADQIRAAVEEGFRQAGALTGPLPGAAGKLNQDTHTLTFEKLEMRLVEAKARAYNQGSQPIPLSA